MQMINYISNLAIPFIMLIIVGNALMERKKTFEIFLDGAKEGLGIVIQIFPTLVGIFAAIGLLRNSGFLELIINIISPITNLLYIPKEVMPLVLLRPISGSGAIAIGTDIMKTYGIDSLISLITATIMGSTETTIYVLSVYTSVTKVKNTRFVLFVTLLGDFIGIITAVTIWRILSKGFYWHVKKLIVL